MSQPADFAVFRQADAPKTQDNVQERQGEINDGLLSSHSGDVDAAYAVAGTVQFYPTERSLKLHDGTTAISLLTPAAAAPADSTSPGTAGQFWIHAGGIDICIATDTWIRVAGATF